MRKRKRERVKERTWEIRRLKGTPVALVGLVNACRQVHFVNPATGKVLGEEDERVALI